MSGAHVHQRGTGAGLPWSTADARFMSRRTNKSASRVTRPGVACARHSVALGRPSVG